MHAVRRPLASLALLACATGASAAHSSAPPAPPVATRQVQVQKIFVADGTDGALAGPDGRVGIVVEQRSATGEEGSAVVRILGSDATTIDVSDLQVGDERDLDLKDGRAATVRRTDDGLVLAMDGRDDVVVPLGDPAPAAELRVVSATHGTPFAMATAPEPIDFDSLEALKGLDRRTREAAIAAVKEIMASRPHVMAFAFDTAAVAPEAD